MSALELSSGYVFLLANNRTYEIGWDTLHTYRCRLRGQTSHALKWNASLLLALLHVLRSVTAMTDCAESS